jgi:hypothetical protein
MFSKPSMIIRVGYPFLVLLAVCLIGLPLVGFMVLSSLIVLAVMLAIGIILLLISHRIRVKINHAYPDYKSWVDNIAV